VVVPNNIINCRWACLVPNCSDFLALLAALIKPVTRTPYLNHPLLMPPKKSFQNGLNVEIQGDVNVMGGQPRAVLCIPTKRPAVCSGGMFAAAFICYGAGLGYGATGHGAGFRYGATGHAHAPPVGAPADINNVAPAGAPHAPHPAGHNPFPPPPAKMLFDKHFGWLLD
jgi:hypothetical protein